mgnify:CR=1 FL=1
MKQLFLNAAEKAEYYISYGLALMKNEKYEDAIKQLEKAILDKDNQIVLENNKAAYLLINSISENSNYNSLFP